MFLVVYTIRTPAGHFLDEWQCHESAEDARAAYSGVTQRADLFTACLARPIESTDYVVEPCT